MLKKTGLITFRMMFIYISSLYGPYSAWRYREMELH